MTPTGEAETDTEDVVVECEMDAPPETLWRALTEEALASDWLGARAEPADGNGPSYRILEARPYSRVRYAWHDPAFPDAPSVVTVELEPLGDGHTRFRLTHGGAAESRRAMAANANRPPLARAA